MKMFLMLLVILSKNIVILSKNDINIDGYHNHDGDDIDSDTISAITTSAIDNNSKGNKIYWLIFQTSKSLQVLASSTC